MSFTVEAVYENGVLKPLQPLPFREHEKVEVSVRSKEGQTPQAAGVIPCQDPALIEWAAMSPDLEYPSDEDAP